MVTQEDKSERNFLFEDRNGGSSMHHVWQGADYFQKTYSPPLPFFFPSSLPLTNSGINIIY